MKQVKWFFDPDNWTVIGLVLIVLWAIFVWEWENAAVDDETVADCARWLQFDLGLGGAEAELSE